MVQPYILIYEKLDLNCWQFKSRSTEPQNYKHTLIYEFAAKQQKKEH